LAGSAVANVVAQLVPAALFTRALVSEQVPLRPVVPVLLAQLGMGRDLVLRSLSFQVCFLSAAAVAAHISVAVAAAHQIVLQLWFFLALVLDSLAIAAQSLVGAALGAGDDRKARSMAWQITRYGLVFGLLLGMLFAVLADVLPRVFTAEPSVLAAIGGPWWLFVAIQPVAGVVFGLDGVLLGAGDAAFLRTATLIAAGLGFLPTVWASLLFGWGLVGIWTGLVAFMLLRLVAVLARAWSGRWVVLGAVRS
jgi:putative MATE family efflux protein